MPQFAYKKLVNDLYTPKTWDGAASLSFYLLLSVFPAIVILLSAISFIPYEEISQEMSTSFFLLLIGKFLTSIIANHFLYEISELTIIFFRYLLIETLLLFIFSFIYYLGPNIKQKFKLFTLGSLFTSFGFLFSTFLFAYYLNSFANYTATYGSIGAAIGLMMWFYIIGFLIIFGAKINFYAQKHQ